MIPMPRMCRAFPALFLLAALPAAGDAPALLDLNPILAPIRADASLPALAAAVILDGKLAGLGAVGDRKWKSGVPVTIDDQFHLGSCTKAMTATLLLRLADRGLLKWDAPLEDLLPELKEEMHPGFRKITLDHLLTHRAGLSGESWPKGETFDSVHALFGTPREQRWAYARRMLAQAPESSPGEKYVYANAGYTIAGVIAERAADLDFESLLRREIFEPLGMTHSGFGAMGAPGALDQPWQHRAAQKKKTPIPPGPKSDNPPALAPAGTVHASMRDWAAFIAAHLTGLANDTPWLSGDQRARLHAPLFGGEYALGWIVTQRDWAEGVTLTHAGSNNQNFAVAWLAPRKGFAVLVAANQADERGVTMKACDAACAAIIRVHLLGDP